MSWFSPVAIVGRACVLPGALDPYTLWRRVRDGHDLLSDAPEGRWGLGFDRALTDDPKNSDDRTWSRRGGYVGPFVPDLRDLDVDTARVARQDPLFAWTLHAGRGALQGVTRTGRERGSVFLGNLSFPTRGMSRFAESVWWKDAPPAVRAALGLDEAEPSDRFMSGTPALHLARAVGFDGEALALDAACASSLYALRLACDALHDGRADLALAGAVNRSDDLFIHVGFSALQALSRTGQSRPFHPGADGLVPAEGCVLFALKRLPDAERDGDRVFGVIRGIGLSNDGRGGGILSPDPAGQERAMRAAYAMAGLEPADLGLLECHATGTPVGDKAEITSMGRLYAGLRDVAIGSIKSNMGHPITAAGGAGLIKVLGALAEGLRPPTLHAPERPPVLEGTPFRLVTRTEAWEGHRRAAVSAFGFGGNNAHLLVEQYRPGAHPAPTPPRPRAAVGVVALAGRVADGATTAHLAETVLGGLSHLQDGAAPAAAVTLELPGLRFPPNDLHAVLPQQLLLLATAREVAARVGELPRERTGVFVGMGADAEVCRYGARWRLAEWGRALGWDADRLDDERDAVVPVLTPAGVVGTMPNIPANRLNVQLDVVGPGFTVSAEELSGTAALRLGLRAVATGELDLALVGAADLSCEPAHRAAARALGIDAPPGDGAVVLALQRVDDARAAGRPVLAVLAEERPAAPDVTFVAGARAAGATGGPIHDLASQVGHAHAASGLLAVAAATLTAAHRALPGRGGHALPRANAEAVVAAVTTSHLAPAQAVGRQAWSARTADLQPWIEGGPPQIKAFQAPDRASLAARVAAGEAGGVGPVRLAIVARTADQLAARAAAASAALLRGEAPAGEGIAFGEGPAGAVALVCGPAAHATAGLGRTFLLAYPQLWANLPVGGTFDGRAPRTAAEHVWATATLALAHARFLREIARLDVDMALGLSHGEIHALFATGAWSDLTAYADEVARIGVYDHLLAGRGDALSAAWGDDATWTSRLVRASSEAVAAAMSGEERVFHLARWTDDEHVLGGDIAGIDRVTGRLGAATGVAPAWLGHAPVAEAGLAAWRALHQRPTEHPGIRHYFTHGARTWLADADAVADALAGSLTHRVDAPALFQRAWEDGARVFVTVGPQDVVARWIGQALAGRPHRVVSLDHADRDALDAAWGAVATLWAAGAPVDLAQVQASLPAPATTTPARSIQLPAHRPPVPCPAVDADAAPALAAADLPPGDQRDASTGTAAAANATPADPRFDSAVRSLPLAPPSGPDPIAANATPADPRFDSPVRSLPLAPPSGPDPIAANATPADPRFDSPVRSLPLAPPSGPDPIAANATPADPRFDSPVRSLPLAPPSGPDPIAANATPADPRFDSPVRSLPLAPPSGPDPIAANATPADPRFDFPPDTDPTTGPDVLEDPAFADSGWSDDAALEPAVGITPSVIAPLAEPAACEDAPAAEGADAAAGAPTDASVADAPPRPRSAEVHATTDTTPASAAAPVAPVASPTVAVTTPTGPPAATPARDAPPPVDIAHPTAAPAGAGVHPAGARSATSTPPATARPAPPTAPLAPAPAPSPATRKPDMSASNPTVLPPPPRLPPVLPARADGAALLGGGSAPPRIVRLPDTAPGADAAPAAAPVIPPTTTPSAAPATAPVVGAPTDDQAALLRALTAEQRRIHEAHQAFLASQADMHARFLAARQQAAEILARAAQAPPATPPPVRPTPPVAPTVTPAVAAPPVTATPVAPAPAAPSKPVPTAAAPKAPPAPPPPVAPKPAAAAPVAAPPTPAPAAKAAPRDADAPVPPVPAAQLPGLKLDREGLKVHSSGAISRIFGPMFTRQDGYVRQVRMPEPPLLLADRVVGLDCTPGELGRGTIWTETDITPDAWYLHQGRMPAGVMIEAGQADLMLISYMGIDFLNQDERVYRLLGCTLTYHDNLPKVGDTIRYDIHVDGHANTGDVRLFFFHYDCRDQAGRRRLSVRGGQAGFFTEAELADSAGVLWDAETGEHDANARRDPPDVACTRSHFTRDHIESFALGDAFACFGPGFELAQTHNDTPRIQRPPMLFFHEVEALDADGGPWKRGYLRARWDVSPEDWFFQGHFKNDPCMPGTLMFEGCVQALAFYLAGMGYTLRRDGWRFEPVTGQPIAMRCRGQVLPNAKVLTYEVFVEEVHRGPEPMIYADLLCTVDGLKAFHARRCGLRLTPAWPLDYQDRALLAAVPPDPEPVAVADGFRFDYRSMLACAWGRPSEAFGPMYRPFDGPRSVPRLPGPPYHFLTRATRLDGPIGGMKVGTQVQVAYDVPPNEWYFRENGAPTMPFAVFLEAALQPCGWLASYIGSALTAEEDLFFRNLDGTGTLTTELLPDCGTLLTDVTLTQLSRSAGMIIVGFDVTCHFGGPPVYLMKTVFGFFPAAALANQKGLPVGPEERARMEEPSDFLVDLTSSPERYCAGSLRLAAPMLRMIDRVTGWWPGAGAAGLGRLRSEKDVDPAEWFFKAHFFQDPVQPGSLGLEAMIQLLQFYMLLEDLGAGMKRPRFEPIALDVPLTWKYRGQVVPRNKKIHVTMEITEVRREARGPVAVATASLWVDGLRIYEAKNMGMRIVEGGDDGGGDGGAPEGGDPPKEPLPAGRPDRGAEATAHTLTAWSDDDAPSFHLDDAPPATDERTPDLPTPVADAPEATDDLSDHTVPAIDLAPPGPDEATVPRGAHDEVTVVAVDPGAPVWASPDGAFSSPRPPPDDTPPPWTFDVTRDAWVADHRPTYTVAALPMMVLADRIAAAAHHAWPDRQIAALETVEVLRWVRADPAVTVDAEVIDGGDVAKVMLVQADGGRRDAVARGRVRWRAAEAPVPLEPVTGEEVHGLYTSGAVFHGPSFHLVTRLMRTHGAATAWLDLDRDGVMPGLVRPGVLDAALHAIPHDHLEAWLPGADADAARGMVGYPLRIATMSFHRPLPDRGTVRVEARFAGFDGPRRPAFDVQLLDDAGVCTSLRLIEVLVPKGPLGAAPPELRRAFLQERRYVPGMALSTRVGEETQLRGTDVAASDWLPGTVKAIYGLTGADVVGEVAMRDHAARRFEVHPSTIVLHHHTAHHPTHPLNPLPMTLRAEGGVERVRGEPVLDLESVASWWDRWFGLGRWPVEDLDYSLIERFVRRVIIEDPAGFEAIHGRPVLYLANHQVAIESLLFSVVVSALSGLPTLTIAKDEHRHTWLGRLIGHSFAWPAARDPGVIAFFARDDREELPKIIGELSRDMAGGTRSVMVHAEGTRSLDCCTPVARLSSAFLDMAMAVGAPIVPVRFTGGLPATPLAERIDFPLGFGKQDIWLGTPILPAELAKLPYKQRKDRVLDGMNQLGPAHADEAPLAPDPAFGEAVRAWQARWGVDAAHATVGCTLMASHRRCAETEALLAFAETGRLDVPAGPKGEWLRELARRLYGR